MPGRVQPGQAQVAAKALVEAVAFAVSRNRKTFQQKLYRLRRDKADSELLCLAGLGLYPGPAHPAALAVAASARGPWTCTMCPPRGRGRSGAWRAGLLDRLLEGEGPAPGLAACVQDGEAGRTRTACQGSGRMRTSRAQARDGRGLRTHCPEEEPGSGLRGLWVFRERARAGAGGGLGSRPGGRALCLPGLPPQPGPSTWAGSPSRM